MANNPSPFVGAATADIPNGGIQALTTAATGALALEIAFLGYWGFGAASEALPWHWTHIFVAAAFLLAFFCLASVAWLVTKPGLTLQTYALGRSRYCWGIAALGLGVFLAASISRFH